MYYFVKNVKRWIKSVLGLRTYAKRYDQLLEEIDNLRPKTILEIGTNDGTNAVRLIKRASLYQNDVVYFGFDMFEVMNEANFLREFALQVPTQNKVEQYLVRNKCKRLHLFPGNTVETLRIEKERLPKMDLVFIDGGHSQETVASDWKNVQDLLHKDSVVFFDDYPNWGVGPIVDAIDPKYWDVKIMPIEDIFPVDRRFTKDPNVKKMRFKFARVKPHSNAL